MYTLHIGNKNYSSWSLRPWVLMRVLGIEFEEKLSRFGQPDTYQAFRKFSPTGLVPLLGHGEISVWDSLAIAEYLAEAYPGVWPTDRTARAFARSAAAEIHSGFSTLRDICGMNCGLRIALNEISAPLQKNLDRLDELWGEGLDRFGGPFLAGNTFTAADAFYCPVAFRVQTYGLKLAPASMAYVARLLELPAMQAWYEAGLAETFRDDVHEAEQRAVGTWTADLRAPVS